MQPDADGETTENTWLTQAEVPVTSLQPLRLSSEAADSFYDFDIEPESPGSPIDECEYTRLIETTTTTPSSEPTVTAGIESGYVCASPCSSTQGSEASQNNSSESQYFDPEVPDAERDESKLSNGSATVYYDCVDSRQGAQSPKPTSDSPPEATIIPNGHAHAVIDSDSCSESLPPSQSTDSNLTYTVLSSASNSTLQDEGISELQAEEKEEAEEAIEAIEAVEAQSTEPAEDREPSPERTMLHVDEELILDCKIEIVKADEVVPQSEPVERDSTRLGSITETDEEDDEKPQKLRRSSSLKTGKTPPGTPGRKKIVRFADVLGLDLADVKTFLDHEVPKIPKSAYDDLDYTEQHASPFQPLFGPPVEKMLVPLFQQPGGLPSFLDKVRERQVCLENAAVTDPINMTITGTVRVRNLDFHKSVYIRYSLDQWKSYSDLQANYVEASCDGFSDKFSFMFFGNSLTVGQRIEMAIRFHCKGQQFWDNNLGTNYCFQCLPSGSRPKTTSVPSPVAHPPNECSGAFY